MKAFESCAVFTKVVCSVAVDLRFGAVFDNEGMRYHPYSIYA